LGGDYTRIPIVDPSGNYTGSYFLDVFYVDDHLPGACIEKNGIWTTNPLKWFRLACVDPVPRPILSLSPADSIGYPARTPLGEELHDTIDFINIGTAVLNVTSIEEIELTGPSGWLAVGGSHSFQVQPGPRYAVIRHVYINDNGMITEPTELKGYIVIHSDSYFNPVDSIYIHVLVTSDTSLPETDTIMTARMSLVFNNIGNMGESGNLQVGGLNMNFQDDCDTTCNNPSCSNDNASIYLYDASPFVAYIKGGDTAVEYSMYDYYVKGEPTKWMTGEFFMPQQGLYLDQLSYPDYVYAHSGRFVTSDSSIAVEVEYYAPKQTEHANFIVVRDKFYKVSGDPFPINNVYLGTLMDWDIPSDFGVRNGSDYDPTKKLMYCYGAEYGPDLIANNDCVLADQRQGGLAYYAGYKLPLGDSIGDPKAMWTENNAIYVYPENDFVPGQMYKLFVNKNGYSTWEPPSPESLYTDLHMVCVYGKWNFGLGDTLIFCNIIASEYNGGDSALKVTIDDARAWITDHPGIFPRPPVQPCDCRPGDPNNNNVINILDITYLINFVYKGGPAPVPYALCSGDPNGNCVINILDITYLINYVYKGGPAPVTCEQWLASCGPPLRK
jgi:hypothetical protein